jgi:hypothetical protein
LRQGRDQAGRQRQQLEKELARLRSSIERLVDAVEATGISRSLRERLEQRETERCTLEACVQELSACESQGELRVSNEVVEQILEDLERGIQEGVCEWDAIDQYPQGAVPEGTAPCICRGLADSSLAID